MPCECVATMRVPSGAGADEGLVEVALHVIPSDTAPADSTVAGQPHVLAELNERARFHPDNPSLASVREGQPGAPPAVRTN